jgi:hypothetical protein
MAEYLLKITGSNEVVNIVYYDGTGSFDAPDGYYFEVLTVDQNLISMSYFVSESFAPESLDDIPYYHGNISGIFSGELTGSILVNGKLFDNIFNETAFGELLLLSGSDIGYASQSNGFYASENNIQLPISNLNYEKQHRYYDVLNNIIDNNISNYVITFKNKYDPEVNFQYLVLNTELTSSGTSSYYDIQGSVVYTSSFEKYGINPFFENHKNHNPEWHIDFDLGDKPIVGQVYVNGDKLENALGKTKTGSFTGSFTGSAELTGSFFGQFEGLLDGTASYAGYALTSSFTENASTVEVFLKSKNWTKPSWAKTIRVTCIGGGGGGGAAPATETSGIVAGGGGGGGGTITIGEFDADTLPSTISVTIGAGGNGGVYDGVILKFASNGGDTYFGDYLIARGGNHGFNGGVESLRALGGSTIANIEYKNTGAGGGGTGTVDGNILNIPLIFDASMAPPLPLPIEYIRTGLGGPDYNYYSVIPTPIPAVIAPTGGGGGLGYDPDNGGRQDGVTTGGSISEYSLTNNKNKYKSLTPILYNSSSYEYYPGFNSKVGLGGKGGNPYLLAGPTDGTMYGGGGGGAYGGGVDGIYANGQLNGTEYNFGANGAIGAVIIISEA